MKHKRWKVSRGLAMVLLGAVGCGTRRHATVPVPSAGVLSYGDMVEHRNAYDAIVARRGNWLWGQPARACQCDPVVYIAGVRGRSVGDLLTIQPVPGIRITRLGPRDASARFGRGHEGGAIVIEYSRQ